MRAAPIFFFRGAPVLPTPALSEGPCGTALTSRATNRSSRFRQVIDKSHETISRRGLLKGRFGVGERPLFALRRRSGDAGNVRLSFHPRAPRSVS
jgi:hypothetical protein